MTQPVLLPSPPALSRREKRGVGEVAGGATAECVAVCCCFPCAVMDMVVLAVYKVPAGLCKKAIHKSNRQRSLKNNENSSNTVLLQRARNPSDEIVKTTLEEHLSKADMPKKGDEATEQCDMEKELHAQFNGTGFWRGPSRH
ncbi:hypothetical protein L6164_022191 [Bauhinia variegata]|uniref:Uncharacterized protein n=1 Tax=Bauhinia variegata TaxID=167791 RepID=A0ACB9MFW2_BAUVA|nr:hypothetical protein L6164_022191 [Bauhinia variegata]